MTDQAEQALLWNEIFIKHFRAREWDKSLQAIQQAFAIDSGNPIILHNAAMLLQEFARFNEARKFIELAATLAPENREIQLALAIEYLAEGEFQVGWEKYEARLPLNQLMIGSAHSQAVRGFVEQKWSGQTLAGKMLMLWAEQGFGDSILFSRYLPELVARMQREHGQVIYYCYEPLRSLLWRSAKDHMASGHLLICTFGSPKFSPPAFHFHCPLASLPLRLSDTLKRIPPPLPLLADPQKAEAWRDRLTAPDKDLRVGLSWTGLPENKRNAQRSIDVLALAQALKHITGVTFYSLQRGHSDEARAAASAGLKLNDFTADLHSFDDTTALLSNLDLVISVDTVTAHLAGTLNLPAWVMLDVNPYWLWGRTGTTSLWYSSVRLYRQKVMDDWTSVLEEICSDLQTHRKP